MLFAVKCILLGRSVSDLSKSDHEKILSEKLKFTLILPHLTKTALLYRQKTNTNIFKLLENGSK